MTDYPPGAIKRNTDTLSVAVRTSIIDAEGRMAWMVATLDRGGYYATDEAVADWPDVVLRSTAHTRPAGGAVAVAAETGGGGTRR